LATCSDLEVNFPTITEPTNDHLNLSIFNFT